MVLLQKCQEKLWWNFLRSITYRRPFKEIHFIPLFEDIQYTYSVKSSHFQKLFSQVCQVLHASVFLINLLTLSKNSLYMQETVLYVKEKGTCITMVRYILMIQELAQITINMFKAWTYDSKWSAAGYNIYNKVPTCIKQIRNNCLLKRKLKEPIIKGYHYWIEYMNDNFINIAFWCM
jgi:hypothetical protein